MTDIAGAAACTLACVRLPDAGWPSLEPLLRQRMAAVAPAQLDRIDRLRQQADRLRSMLGQLLLRHLLRAAGLTEAPQIDIGPYGKPCLRLAESHLRAPEFNISHAGRWVVCALAPTPVGIDIEQVRAIDLGIAERYFQRAEHAALMRLTSGQRLDRFFRLWTAKEAYVKALGLGLHRDFASFGVAPLDDPLVHPQPFALTYPAVEHGYHLALCSAARAPLQPTTVTIARLLAPHRPA